MVEKLKDLGYRAWIFLLTLLSLLLVLVPVLQTFATADDTSEPSVIGGLCGEAWHINKTAAPEYTDFAAPLSYKHKDTADGVIGDKLSISGYSGEYTKPKFSLFWFIDIGTDGPQPSYEDGTERPAWGDNKEDLRIYPNNGAGRACITLMQQLHLMIINGGLGVNEFIWKVGNWFFEVTSTNTFVKDFNKMIGDAMGGKNGLKQSIFLTYSLITIMIVGVWGIIRAIKGGAVSAVAGLGWMLGILIIGSLALSNPVGLSTQIESVVGKVQTSIVSVAGKVTADDDTLCGGLSEGEGIESEGTARAVSCASWRALIFEPATIMQWGKSSGELEEIKGKKPPAVDVGSKKIQNWAFYGFWSQILHSESDDSETVNKRFVRVVDAVASPEGDHTLFDKWSVIQFNSLGYDLLLGTGFLIATIVVMIQVIGIGIRLMLYGIMAALMIFLLPFVLVIGIHPTVGKTVMTRWAGSYAGTFIHRIILAIWLSIFLTCLMFCFNYMQGDSASQVLKGIIFIMIMIMAMSAMRNRLGNMVSTLMPGAESVDGELDKAKKGAAIGLGAAAATTIAGGTILKRRHDAKVADRGSLKDRIGNAKDAFNESKGSGDSTFESLRKAREASKDSGEGAKAAHEFIGGQTDAGEGRDVWGKEGASEDNGYGAGRQRRGESDENYEKRKAKAKAAWEAYGQFGDTSLEELKENNFGLKRGKKETKKAFASRVKNAEMSYNNMSSFIQDKRFKKERRTETKLNVPSRTSALLSTIGAGLSTLTQPTYGDSPLRVVGMSGRRGAHTARLISARTSQGKAKTKAARDEYRPKRSQREGSGRGSKTPWWDKVLEEESFDYPDDDPYDDPYEVPLGEDGARGGYGPGVIG